MEQIELLVAVDGYLQAVPGIVCFIQCPYIVYALMLRREESIIWSYLLGNIVDFLFRHLNIMGYSFVYSFTHSPRPWHNKILGKNSQSELYTSLWSLGIWTVLVFVMIFLEAFHLFVWELSDESSSTQNVHNLSEYLYPS